jgi:hypothetical protein
VLAEAQATQLAIFLSYDDKSFVGLRKIQCETHGAARVLDIAEDPEGLKTDATNPLVTQSWWHW